MAPPIILVVSLQLFLSDETLCGDALSMEHCPGNESKAESHFQIFFKIKVRSAVMPICNVRIWENASRGTLNFKGESRVWYLLLYICFTASDVLLKLGAPTHDSLEIERRRS